MTCLLLSNCGLIGAAMRLAPLIMLFADNEKTGPAAHSPSAIEARGRQVAGTGRFAPKNRGHDSTASTLVSR